MSCSLSCAQSVMPFAFSCSALCPTLSFAPPSPFPTLPCPALPYPTLPCPALRCPALPCPLRPDLPYHVPCPVMPCSAPSYPSHPYALPCPALPSLALPRPTLPCPALSCPAQPYALPSLALPCPALLCSALPCLALPCHALTCPALRSVHTIRPHLPPCSGTYQPPSSSLCRTPDLPLPSLYHIVSAVQLLLQHQSFCVTSHAAPCLAYCDLYSTRVMTPP